MIDIVMSIFFRLPYSSFSYEDGTQIFILKKTIYDTEQNIYLLLPQKKNKKVQQS